MIRKATVDDAAAIVGIYNGYILGSTATFETEPLSTGQMAGRIEDVLAQGMPYYVSEADGRVVGYAYAHRWKERAAYAITAETSVYVAPEAQGQGIAWQLMERVIADCRASGLHSLIACITAENTTSVAFHKKIGYRKVSHFVEVGCKFGRLLDVVDLQKRLVGD